MPFRSSPAVLVPLDFGVTRVVLMLGTWPVPIDAGYPGRVHRTIAHMAHGDRLDSDCVRGHYPWDV